MTKRVRITIEYDLDDDGEDVGNLVGRAEAELEQWKGGYIEFGDVANAGPDDAFDCKVTAEIFIKPC